MLDSKTKQFMHEKALQLAFYDLNWAQVFKYFALIVQIMVLPVAFTTCSISLYAIVKAVLKNKRKRKNEKIEKKYSLRRNYEQNKRVAKKMRRGIP